MASNPDGTRTSGKNYESCVFADHPSDCKCNATPNPDILEPGDSASQISHSSKVSQRAIQMLQEQEEIDRMTFEASMREEQLNVRRIRFEAEQRQRRHAKTRDRHQLSHRSRG